MVKIFCDFDGTITPNDVGGELFCKFTNGKAIELVDKWKVGQIDSREMYLRSLQHLRITREDLDEFLQDQKIDPYFAGFVKFCEDRSFSLFVLSDGMDVYIRSILERNELGYLDVYSNKLVWHEDKTLTVEFPYFDHTCGRCGNCKGYHMRRLKENQAELILVGDGLSDICAAKEAHLIFAKSSLAEYCLENEVPFISFQDFSDVTVGLKKHFESRMELRR